MIKKLKERKCKNKSCGKIFTPMNPLQTICSWECYSPIYKQRKEAEWKIKKKVLKEKVKTVTDYRKDARYWFQRFIRIRDLNKSCISCDKHLTDIRDYHAGHLYQANNHPQLLFNEQAVNGQCIYCNKYRSGNETNYRIGIQKRYGAEVLIELEKLADDKTKRVLTKEYYLEITERYKLLCKGLENK